MGTHKRAFLSLVAGLVLVVAALLGSSCDAPLYCGAGHAGVCEEREVLLQSCGGFVGTSCPRGYSCSGAALEVDGPGACRRLCTAGDPRGCEPTSTCVKQDDDCDGDCPYICRPQACGGAIELSCARGFECVDDATDTCYPAAGESDCPGSCVRAAE